MRCLATPSINCGLAMATAITKRAHGIGTKHVLVSNGPSVDPMHAYSSTYSVQFGQIKPCLSSVFRHKGTGYAANFRPAIYYNKKVDSLQNPAVAKLLDDVYGTLTFRNFGAHSLPSGWEVLPESISYSQSGFAHNIPNTRAHSTHLASQNTAYRGSYLPKPFRSDGVRMSSNSNKEESGFTHAWNVEPVTFRPTENHSGGVPGELTWRPTGRSVLSHDFCQPTPLTGLESLPVLSGRADLSNGFIKGHECPANAQPQESQIELAKQMHPNSCAALKKSDPAVHSTVVCPDRYNTITRLFYPRQNIHPHTKTDTDIGKKELSGYSDNHAPVTASQDSNKHQSIYTDSFRGQSYEHPNLLNASPCQSDGFTKSTKVHAFGQSEDVQTTFRNMHPYVARSLVSKEPYILENVHRSKIKE